MAQKNRVALTSDIDSKITTNGTGAITGIILHDVLIDMVDSAFNVIDDAGVFGLSDYNGSNNYVIGDHVTESGRLYRANGNTTGAFAPAKWDEIGLTGRDTISAGFVPKADTSDGLINSIMTEVGTNMSIAGGLRVNSTSDTGVVKDLASNAGIFFNENGNNDVMITNDNSLPFTDAYVLVSDNLTEVGNATEYRVIVGQEMIKAKLATGGDITTGAGDRQTSMIIAARSATYKQNVVNSVILGGIGSIAKTDNTTYVQQLGFTQSATIEGLLVRATLTGSRTWTLPDESIVFGAPAVSQVISSGLTTTISAVDVLMPGMTITPGAGNYVLNFSGTVIPSTSNDTVEVSIYINGVQEAASVRSFLTGGGQTVGMGSTPGISGYKITVGASQAVEIRWRILGGGLASITERNLSLTKAT